jgi:hypothetical protein
MIVNVLSIIMILGSTNLLCGWDNCAFHLFVTTMFIPSRQTQNKKKENRNIAWERKEYTSIYQLLSPKKLLDL